MNYQRDRRLFLKSGASAMAIAAANRTANLFGNEATNDPSEPKSVADKFVVGVMGVNNRGLALAKGFAGLPNAEVGAICDVDQDAAEKALNVIESLQHRPKQFRDIRTMLDDPSIDALVIAAPNHWHAPATILGCAAGKHVYVEKPCSQTAQEGEWAIDAARRHNRVVQMGTQRRSWPGIIEAIGKLHAGEIGDVKYARTWYNNRRESIGAGKVGPIPKGLDWDLWQGPAPRRDFQDNVVPYNWHWHWHWGNGELGNNGVHGLDVARWGADVTFPDRVTASGGKYRHDDSQTTPDTMMVSYEFPEQKMITWEGLSWSPLGPHDDGFGISFHGTEGSMVLRGGGYVIYDMRNKEVASGSGSGGDVDHLTDFLDAVKTGRRPNADIEIAHQSTLLCHLGNIAFRSREVLNIDPKNGHIIDAPDAERLWSRDYAPQWRPKV